MGRVSSNGSTDGLVGRISADPITLRKVTSESTDSSFSWVWDWAIVSCQTLIFTRFFNSYHLGFSPDLWDGMCSHYSWEKTWTARCELWGPGSSGIPYGCCRNLGLSLVSSSAEQLKSPLQWMDEEDLSDICCRSILPCIRTWRSNFLSCGALATWMRWAATALALTDGCVDLGDRWAAPSRRISAQLFWLECVKFIFDVSSS